MKRCESCKVNINNPYDRCPLCYTTLVRVSDAVEPLSYPNIVASAERYNLLLRILLFLSVTVSIICVTINLLAPQKIWWSLIVVINILYVWAAVGTAIRKNRKIGLNIFIQAVSLSLLLIVIDYFTGQRSWALNYAVPFLLITATLSITTLIIVKHMDSASFALYFILTTLLGFVPMLLSLFGLISVMWPSISCGIYSAISLISLFIFADRATKSELKKRFHL